MDPKFWQQKWESNEIGFHESEANPLLVKHFDQLALAPGARVFVPLCGKTLDIGWLLSRGMHVLGAELIESAVEQLFAELGVTPAVSSLDDVRHYSAAGVDIFVGDIFAVSAGMLGAIDAIYDRAALVALPEAMRCRYSAHLREICDNAPQLLISYEYDQARMGGPPFSVSDAEVNRHYRSSHRITRLACNELPEGLKGKCAATEKVWLLSAKASAG